MGHASRQLARTRRGKARLLRVGTALAKTAERTGAMGVAAAQTIGYRTSMMMRAAGNPAAMADPEFTRMVSEKVDAVMRSGLAVGAGLPAFQTVLANWVAAQAAITSHAMAALAQCRSAADLAVAQARYLESLQTAGTAAGTRLAEAAIDVTEAGLDPVHRTAAANARRLAREHG